MPDLGNTTVFSQTDASNATGTMPSWSGTALPSTIDDAGRALQGAVFREWNWRNPTITSGGSANTQTLTYSVAPAALYNGQSFAFLAGYTNTGATTLNVNSLGATAIKKLVNGTAVALTGGEITAGNIVRVSYNTAASAFLMDNVDAVWKQGADIASASTVTMGEGGYFNITGTTTITALAFSTDKAGRSVVLKFAGALTLTHNATSLILPGGANISTAAGDVATFVSEGSGNFRCTNYTRATGSVIVPGVQLTAGTAVATTSGTAVDFTNIPSWVKRITVSFSGVDNSGGSANYVRLGTSAGFETTGYSGGYSTVFGNDQNSSVSVTVGFGGSSPTSGVMTITKLSSTTWAASMVSWYGSGSLIFAGSKTLSTGSPAGQLTQIRITPASGSFNAGSVNIMYE